MFFFPVSYSEAFGQCFSLLIALAVSGHILRLFALHLRLSSSRHCWQPWHLLRLVHGGLGLLLLDDQRRQSESCFCCCCFACFRSVNRVCFRSGCLLNCHSGFRCCSYQGTDSEHWLCFGYLRCRLASFHGSLFRLSTKPSACLAECTGPWGCPSSRVYD